jgi:RNA polymerase sigma-70 factor (ECF subfamily)
LSGYSSEFIKKLQVGDKTAFSELVKEYRSNVLNLCYRFLLNRADAEDLAQEVFIEVYQSIRNFREDAQLSTWLYRIAVTKSLDELRRQKSKKRLTTFGAVLGLDHLLQTLVGSDNPQKKLEEKEGHKALLQALDTLPENQRVALTLSKLEGLSNPEIAEIMGTTVTAIESLIYRGKKNLQKKLI